MATATTSSSSSPSSSTLPKPALLKSAEIIGPSTYHNVLIWIHGLGDSSAGFSDLFHSLALPATRVILPNAPVMPVTLNGGMRMQSWYDIYSLDHRAEDSKTLTNEQREKLEDAKTIEQNAALLQELITYESANVPSTQIFMGGFSQGGAMSLYTGLRSPSKLGGIMSASGYVLLAHRYPQAFSQHATNTQVWTYHGNDDQVVPLAWSQRGYDSLKSHGIQLQTHTERRLGHSMSNQELESLMKFLSTKLKQSKDEL